MSDSAARIHELEQENKELQVQLRDLKRLLDDCKKKQSRKAFTAFPS